MLAASALLEAAAMGINTRNTANDVSLKAAKMLCGGAVLRSLASQVESTSTKNQVEAAAMTAAATMLEKGASALKQQLQAKEDKALAMAVIQANTIGMLVRQETRKKHDAAATLPASAAPTGDQAKAAAAAALVRELRAQR